MSPNILSRSYFFLMPHAIKHLQMMLCRWRRRKKMVEQKVPTEDSGTSLGPRLSVRRTTIYTLLDQLCTDNIEYYSKCGGWTSYVERAVAVCSDIKPGAEKLQDLVIQLQDIAPLYDFNEKTPGNGFRSLVCICDTTVLHLIALLKVVSEQRTSFVFRLSHYCKELEAYSTVVNFLVQALPQCIENQNLLPVGSLFPPLDGNYEQYHDMLKGLEKLDSTCFYGRPLGFQFSPSVNRIFRFIGVVLASYSLSWEKGHGTIGSLINTGRFFLSPEQRALRIIKVTKEADIAFCKGFWNLSELSNNVPKFFCPIMAINELRSINWVGAISLETTDGGIVRIPEPTAHTGPRPVQIRVLSAVHRNHMSSPSSANQPASPYLLFHCHGGGYVATSSKSHETYLRVWAKLLNCTVVSVEYSLAPENPFPRPTEEVLFAYAWIIKNPAQVGWTGEKLCMVGDSAGGNLVMSVNLRLIDLKVKRKPDGIVPVYTPFLFQYLPSPSRLLSVMDPLLHMGVVLRCVAAYTGGYEDPEKPEETVESSGHKSLQEYVEQVQKTHIDFEGGSQSIVSLVQNISDPNANTKTVEAGSFFIESKTNGLKLDDDPGSDNSEGDEDEDDKRSVSSVHIDSDPLHIQLSSSLFDNQLLDFLRKHPTTKDSLTLLDENGAAWDKLEECEEALTGLATNEDESLLRPQAIGLNGSMVAATVPNTPNEQIKTIPSSQSTHNVVGQQAPINKRSLSQSLADTAALAAGHAFDNLQDWLERPTIRDKQKLDRTTSHKEVDEKEEECRRQSHIMDLLNRSAVPRNYLISPMYAPDHLIQQLPPCYFIACHLDPLLDDTIAFASKMKKAGGSVASVDLLPSVPHGFLNFTLMSPECRKGAKVTLQRIKQALGHTDVLP